MQILRKNSQKMILYADFIVIYVENPPNKGGLVRLSYLLSFCSAPLAPSGIEVKRKLHISGSCDDCSMSACLGEPA